MGESGATICAVETAGSNPAGSAFFGSFRHAMDDKHRLTIPSRWRRHEADGFYLLPSQDNEHLSVLPPAEFRRVNETLSHHAGVSAADRRWFSRFYFSQAQHCLLDRQGRLLLPEDFCQLAGLAGDTILIGTFDRFEIWNPARWEAAKLHGSPKFRQVADLIGI